MALIKCEECGKDVSDKAPQCLSCGVPIADTKKDVMIHFGIRGGQIIYSPCYIF